jgi:hypothetical protein
MPDPLDDDIRQNAQGPKRASGDAGSVEQHGLKDQIEADRYLNSKDAVKKKGLGIKITRAIPQHGCSAD